MGNYFLINSFLSVFKKLFIFTFKFKDCLLNYCNQKLFYKVCFNKARIKNFLKKELF